MAADAQAAKAAAEIAKLATASQETQATVDALASLTKDARGEEATLGPVAERLKAKRARVADLRTQAGK